MKFPAHLVLAFVALVFVCLFSLGTPAPSQPATQNIDRPEFVIQSGHSSGVNCLVFDRDGRWLASGGADNSIRIWDLKSGLELRALLGHQSWVRSLAVSNNSELLASGSNDRTIKLWNVSSGRETVALKGHEGAVEAVLFSPDDRWIASGSSDTTTRIWDPASG